MAVTTRRAALLSHEVIANTSFRIEPGLLATIFGGRGVGNLDEEQDVIGHGPRLRIIFADQPEEIGFRKAGL